MTTNQRRAAAIAEAVSCGARSPEALSDSEWSLLLLAAGTNAVAAPPSTVCRCVMECASRGIGYFIERAGDAPGPGAPHTGDGGCREAAAN